jgi:hypothetical protein
VSVRIDPTQIGEVVARRPYAYVVTASPTDGPHVRAVVARWNGDAFVVRVGSRTTDNVSRSSMVTIVWPPLAAGECRDEFDDHTVIADCAATCTDTSDSHELTARPTAAVWHRPAR